MEALDLGEDLDTDDVLGLLDESFPAAPAVTLPAAPTPAASTGLWSSPAINSEVI